MWKKVVLGIFIFLVALFLFKDALITHAISRVGSSVLGAPVKLGSFSWNVLTQQIHIRHLRVYNPAEFPRQPMLDIGRADIDYDLPALLKGDLHFPYVNVDVKDMSIIRNAQGQLNVSALKIAQKSSGQEASAASAPSVTTDRPLQIDVMKLNVERTVYLDEAGGPSAKPQIFDAGLQNKTFRNITSVQQLAALILTQSMAPAAIKGVVFFAAGKVFQSVSMVKGLATGILDGLYHQLK